MLKRFGSGVGFEARVANGKRECAGREASFAQAFTGFLREVTEQGFQLLHVVRVFPEGVIVRDGFRFGVYQEFIGVAAARFAIERGAPLAEDFFQLFLRVRSELLDGFYAKGTLFAVATITDAGNFADGEWREKARF